MSATELHDDDGTTLVFDHDGPVHVEGRSIEEMSASELREALRIVARSFGKMFRSQQAFNAHVIDAHRAQGQS